MNRATLKLGVPRGHPLNPNSRHPVEKHYHHPFICAKNLRLWGVNGSASGLSLFGEGASDDIVNIQGLEREAK
jgi:hypothetical protein